MKKKSEVRSQKSEASSQQSAVGSRQLPIKRRALIVRRPSSIVVVHCSLFIVSLFIASCSSKFHLPSSSLQPPTSVILPPTSVLQLPPLIAETPIPNPTTTPFPTTDFLGVSGPNINATGQLGFNFGTQTAVPTLDWRPPPMPVPVSIRPEDHFWFARPIASNSVNWPHPLYRYGSTYFGFMNAHTGVDLDSNAGTPVLAAGSGVVVWVGYGLLGVKPAEDDPYGMAVVIKHDFGYNNQDMYSVYAHMSKVLVWLDQPVKIGEQIGEVGSTGFSSGPHLHFEVRFGENKFRNTYNPELWLAPPTGWGVLAGRVLDRFGQYISELPIEVIDSRRRHFPVTTYSTRFVNADPIYQENFVLSDLPAGTYTYTMTIDGEVYTGTAEILAGQTTLVIVQETLKDIPLTAEPQSTNGKAPTYTPTPSLTFTPSLTPTVTRTPRPTRTLTPTRTPSPTRTP